MLLLLTNIFLHWVLGPVDTPGAEENSEHLVFAWVVQGSPARQ